MNIRKIGYTLGKTQAKRPWLFIFLALLLTAATLPGIPLLLQHVEPSLEKVLPQDIEEVKLMNDMRSQFGADMLYIVLTTQDANTDVYTQANLEYVTTLSESLRAIDHVQAVRSLSDIVQADADTLPHETATVRALAEQDPRIKQYVSPDRALTVIMVQADTGASAQTVKSVLSDISFTVQTLENKNPGLKTQITGFGAIDNATFAVIISDFTRITLISFGLMVLFLLLHYRFSLKKTVYSMLIMMFSLVWALGITGYVGIQLNVVTMVAAAMIMALGSSYGINSVYHFYDDFLLQYPRAEAIAKFQEFLIIGLTGSALAEIAGFLALLFGIMPTMRDLGIILAIGIFFALVVSVIVLPACFFLLEKERTVSQ